MSATPLAARAAAAADELPPRLRATLRRDVQGMHAYAVQPSAGLIKLDAMENPYPLPAPLQRALGERLGRVAVHRYPGARIADLAAALADHAQLPDGCALMLGNGSDELIDLVTAACAVPQGEAVDGAVPTVLAPVPGFVMYDVAAQLRGLAFVGVPLTGDFEIDADAMLAAVERHRPALTWLAYPNNPTANLWDDAALDAIVDAVARQRGLVVFDEAYQPFAGRTRIAQLARHDHVLVLRTLSKFGLAGVRVGYLCGPRALVAQLDKVRPPYNVSVLNAECALFALEHADEYARQAQAIRAERSRLQSRLAAIAGVRPYPSDANMILVRVADAARTFAVLRDAGVLVKNVSALHPLLANCLRLTVGTPAENDALLAALEDCT